MVKLSEFNVHYLLIDDEPKHTKIGLNYQLSYENKNPVIQLTVGTVKHIHDSIITVCLDKFAIETLREIQTKLIYKSLSVFPNTEFKPFVDNDFMVKITPETKCFNDKKQEIPKSCLETGMKVIILMETKGLWVNKSSSTLLWTIKQVMIIE